MEIKEREREKENIFELFTDRAIINMILYNNNIKDELEYYVGKVSDDKYSANDVMSTLALRLLNIIDGVKTNNRYRYDRITSDKIYGDIDFEETYDSGSLYEGKVVSYSGKIEKNTSYLMYVKMALLILKRNTTGDIKEAVENKLKLIKNNIRPVHRFTYAELKSEIRKVKSESREFILFLSWLIINLVEPDEETGRLDYHSIDNHKLIGSIFEKFVRNVLKNELDISDWVCLDKENERAIYNGDSKVICDIVIGHKENGKINKIYLLDTKAYVDTDQNSNLNSTGGEMHKYFNSWLGKLENLDGVTGQGFGEVKLEKSKFGLYWMDNIHCCLVYPRIFSEASEFSRVYAFPEIWEMRVEIKGTLEEMKENVINGFMGIVAKGQV